LSKRRQSEEGACIELNPSLKESRLNTAEVVLKFEKGAIKLVQRPNERTGDVTMLQYKLKSESYMSSAESLRQLSLAGMSGLRDNFMRNNPASANVIFDIVSLKLHDFQKTMKSITGSSRNATIDDTILSSMVKASGKGKEKRVKIRYIINSCNWFLQVLKERFERQFINNEDLTFAAKEVTPFVEDKTEEDILKKDRGTRQNEGTDIDDFDITAPLMFEEFNDESALVENDFDVDDEVGIVDINLIQTNFKTAKEKEDQEKELKWNGMHNVRILDNMIEGLWNVIEGRTLGELFTSKLSWGEFTEKSPERNTEMLIASMLELMTQKQTLGELDNNINLFYKKAEGIITNDKSLNDMLFVRIDTKGTRIIRKAAALDISLKEEKERKKNAAKNRRREEKRKLQKPFDPNRND